MGAPVGAPCPLAPAIAGVPGATYAPARGTWRQLPLAVLIVGVPPAAALGWALPLLGVTLLAFLVVDVLTGLVRRGRRAA